MMRTFFPALLLLGLFLVFEGNAGAISFDIKPVKIFFDADVKAEKLTIKNSGENDLTLQLKIYKWSQDAEGKDLYEETADVILFPRILKMGKGEEKIVRIGTQLAPAAVEGTFRIYIEEIPETRETQEGAAVSFVTRAGVPLFRTPLKADARGKVESLSVKNGNIEAKVRNEGNLHFIIKSVRFRITNPEGKETFSQEAGGWYLLSGASRVYSASIPGNVCKSGNKLDVEVKTSRFVLKSALNLDGSMCGP